VRLDRPDEDVELEGSPGRLSQVIGNLLSNAVDACRPKGGGVIDIRVARLVHRGVELRVSDRGSGVAPENIKRIFDPMFTTKPFGEGTGLGLAIVHDITTSHFGGTIEVDSRVGEGTTFVLRLAGGSGAGELGV
jgi:signal transduction histidine kinase